MRLLDRIKKRYSHHDFTTPGVAPDLLPNPILKKSPNPQSAPTPSSISSSTHNNSTDHHDYAPISPCSTTHTSVSIVSEHPHINISPLVRVEDSGSSTSTLTLFSKLKKKHSFSSFFTKNQHSSAATCPRSTSLSSIPPTKPATMKKSISMPRLGFSKSKDRTLKKVSSDSELVPQSEHSRNVFKKITVRRSKLHKSVIISSPSPVTTEQPQQKQNIIIPVAIRHKPLKPDYQLHAIQERTHESLDASHIGTVEATQESKSDVNTKNFLTPETSFSNSIIDCYAEESQRRPTSMVSTSSSIPSPTRRTKNTNSVFLRSPVKLGRLSTGVFDDSISTIHTDKPAYNELQLLLNESTADISELNRENHSTPIDEAAEFTTPCAEIPTSIPPSVRGKRMTNNMMDDITFDAVSHSTSMVDSVVPSVLFTDRSSMYNDPVTFREANHIELFKNSLSPKLKVVSPWSQRLSNASPESVQTFTTSATGRSCLGDVNSKLDPLSAEEFNQELSRDEVYRREMLALIERHNSMITKQQSEINALRKLLLNERQVNLAISSPQVNSAFSTPQQKIASSSDECLTLKQPQDNSRKVRKKFIPLNITITDDPKHSKASESNEYDSDLRSPFSVAKFENSSDEQFTLKPFYIKHKLDSPTVNVFPRNREIMPLQESAKLSPKHNQENIRDHHFDSPRRLSVDSCEYFTAEEDFSVSADDEDFDDEALKPYTVNKRDCSGSTISSIMSQMKLNESLNTSVSSIETANAAKNYFNSQ